MAMRFVIQKGTWFKTMEYLIALLILAAIVFLIDKKTKFIAKLQAKHKWKIVQEEIPKIQEIKNKASSRNKASKFFDQITKQSKKKLEKSQEVYLAYIKFCEEKQLTPNSEHKMVERLLDETENALLSPNELLDKELKTACKKYNTVYAKLNESGTQLYSKRQDAVALLDSVEELVNSIASKPKSFETDISEVILHKESFHKTVEYAEEQNKVLKGSALGIGAGTAAGAAVATIAPSAALWVATTFGTASTGTAISALSGAAATNAALAWLGGGAVAAGGGGVAAGQALLSLAGPIGWGIAGVSVIVSVLIAWKERKKISEEKKDEIDRVKRCTESLQELIGNIDALSLKTDALAKEVRQFKEHSGTLYAADYASLSESQKQLLGALVNNAKGLSALLSQNIG